MHLDCEILRATIQTSSRYRYLCMIKRFDGNQSSLKGSCEVAMHANGVNGAGCLVVEMVSGFGNGFGVWKRYNAKYIP